MSSPVEKIKEKLGIADVIGSYITLEKAGANYKAKCPFHNEKSPSFFVSPARNTYYCFGCGQKGDILTFVQTFEGLDFMGALKILADRAGVTLERENPELRTERDRLYLILEHATLYFQRQLGLKTDAREYLKKRGVVEKTARQWRLGYAPADWKTLFTYLKSKNCRPEDIEKVGLIKASEKIPGDYYDRFRGRIMFPLFDASGRVIAFSGRQFESDGTEAKYINSPETPLFEKSKVLYGYHAAKLSIRQADFSLLVEGQMDLLLCHQFGIAQAVASSGTALTTEQLEILGRLSNNLIIAYDGDKAGIAAAQRGLQLALTRGMNVKIAVLPDGKDPADVLLENPELVKQSLLTAQHIITFMLQHILDTQKDARLRALEIEKTILPYIADLQSTIEKSHFISKIAYEAQIKEDVLWQEIRTLEKKNGSSTGYQPRPAPQPASAQKKASLEQSIFSIIFWQEKVPSSVLPILDIKKKLSTILSEDRLKVIEQELSPHKDELAFEAEVAYADHKDLNAHVDDLILRLHEERLKRLFNETMEKLQNAERNQDRDLILSLLQSCQDISAELRKISEQKFKSK